MNEFLSRYQTIQSFLSNNVVHAKKVHESIENEVLVIKNVTESTQKTIRKTFKIPKLCNDERTIETLPKEPHIIQSVNLKRLDRFKVPEEIEKIARGADLSQYEKMIPKINEETYFELTKVCIYLEECATHAPLYGTDLQDKLLKKIEENVLEVRTYVSII